MIYETKVAMMFGGMKNYLSSLESVVDFAQIEPFETVLEICCGTGLVTEYVEQKAHKVMGVELNPRMMQKAKQRLEGSRLIIGDAHELQPDLGKCDLLLCVNAHHHLDLVKFYAMANRMLKPKGRIVMNVKVRGQETLHERTMVAYQHALESAEMDFLKGDGGYVEPIWEEEIVVLHPFDVYRREEKDFFLTEEDCDMYKSYWKNAFYEYSHLEPLEVVNDSQWGSFVMQGKQPRQYAFETIFDYEFNKIKNRLIKKDLFLELRRKEWLELFA